MIGTCSLLLRRLMRRAVSSPSVPGISTSRSMTANCSCRTCRSASTLEAARTSLRPSGSSIASSATRLSGRSSTSSTLAGCRASPASDGTSSGARALGASVTAVAGRSTTTVDSAFIRAACSTYRDAAAPVRRAAPSSHPRESFLQGEGRLLVPAQPVGDVEQRLRDAVEAAGAASQVQDDLRRIDLEQAEVQGALLRRYLARAREALQHQAPAHEELLVQPFVVTHPVVAEAPIGDRMPVVDADRRAQQPAPLDAPVPTRDCLLLSHVGLESVVREEQQRSARVG